jgi:hypothetical protein
LTPSNIATNIPEANELANNMQCQCKEFTAVLQQSKLCQTEGKSEEVQLLFKIGEEAWLNGRNVNLKTKSNK